MQPVQIPFLGHIIALAVGSYLISFFVTAFIVPIQIVTWTATGGAVIGILHHHNLLNPITHLPGGDTIMDLLDRFTNKSQLERMVSGDSPVMNRTIKPEVFDEEAVRSALKSNIIGQDVTIDEMTTTLRRRLAMMQRQKPVAVLLFAGPPGVGKTELAKQMGKIMDRPFMFFDMSTCANEAGASTLFGSPKGYAGSDSYGQLTGGLRAKPNAIILLDEIEKASPDVLTRFLTAWNDGFVTEASTGEKISTTRAIFIATTNAAAKEISDLSKTVKDRDQRLKAVNDALREAKFKPEVLSRVDKVFAFDVIEGLDQARLAIVQVRSLARGFGLEITEDGDGISPEILYDMMERADLLQDAGGVRAVVRALEESLADGFIAVKQSGRDRCRVVLDDQTGFKVEAA